MIKELSIFLFLLIGNAGYSQISDSLNDPALFLIKKEKEIHHNYDSANEWFYIRENNDKWYYKGNKIHFQIQLLHYGKFYPSSQVFHLSIYNLSGHIIGSCSSHVDSKFVVTDSVVLPDNIPGGRYVLAGYINLPLNSDRILDEQFIIDKSTAKLCFLSKNNSYYNNHYLDFFLGPDDFDGADSYVLAVRARSKQNIPQKINGYILKKNFDTISAFETAKNGIGVISKASERMDSMIVRVAWPDKMERDYDVPAAKAQPLLFETNFINDTLQYKMWSTQAYSANVRWLMIIGVWRDKILFSHITNKTGQLYCFMDEFSLKNVPMGIIKLMIFKKGGEKIIEKNLYYPGKI